MLVILMMILATGCDRNDSRLSPFRWKPAGGEFDSLTVAFDYDTWRGVPVDSLSCIIEKAERIANLDTADRLKKSRIHFFKGVTLFKRNLREDAVNEFKTARSLVDSSEYPYDVNRIDFWLVDASKEKIGVDAFFRTMKNIDFYEETGDSALLAMQYGDIGLMLKKYGDFNEAYKAFATSTRLFRSSGLTQQSQASMINTASCLEKMGRHEDACRMLRDLVGDTVFQKNKAGYPLALHNLYVWDNDTDALRLAISLIMESDLRINMRLRGRVLAEYSHEMLNKGLTDSAYHYSKLALGNVGTSFIADSAYVLLNHSEVLERQGNSKGALEWLLKWKDLSKRISDERDAESIHALTTSRLVANARMEAELEHEHRKLFWIVLSFSLLTSLFILLWIFHRYRHRQEMRQMKSQIEKGTLQRKIMSMQIATKDNDSFLYTFATINPNFTQRLKERYPSLSPMDLKLAAFAALKLDIKQVARILGIKPESVKQSRWRLRRKLGLTPDQNLEDALRPYLDEDGGISQPSDPIDKDPEQDV